MSRVLEFGPHIDRQSAVAVAVEAVRRGEVIVLPTDTVYGVGVDAFDADAVSRLLEAKGRGRHMPPPVLVPGRRTLDGLAVSLPGYAEALMERFWPGPLTLIVRSQPSLTWDLGETNGTVAVRVPDHEGALDLLADTGPLAVSSANRSGGQAARTVLDAAASLGDRVSVYLDGGPCGGGVASTIVDCTRERATVVRHGAVDEAALTAAMR